MLEVKGISKHYKNKQILNGISFAAGPGQCVGIAGGNGCGKTTLLSILAGVNRPDRGSICFDGVEAVGNRKVFERNAAYVPQENSLIPELTARDNYRLWFKGDKAELERDLEEGVGKFLGLTEFLGTPAGKLSGGQKKRLSIASALSNQAYLKNGGTVILTSHETQELSICTQLFVMKKGLLMPVTEKLSAAELVLLF